jgi:phage-related protein
MARSLTTPEKPVHWVGSSKKDLLAFPADVVDDLGYALSVVQHGGTPPSAKAWKGEGPGVFELVEEHRGDTFRAVGLIHDRLKTAQADYEVRYARKKD